MSLAGPSATYADQARPCPAPRKRRDAVDFWRGFVLCTIFINHIPGNVFENLTYRNFGFSDSAEAFVFISGLSVALAYGRRFFGAEQSLVVARLLRRAVKLYGVHIGLSLAGIGIFALGTFALENTDLMQPHGRDLVVDDPMAALIGLVSLGHQFGYFNILPMYVLMLAAAPVLLWLARFGRPVMLSASLALYGVARLTGLNVPTWPMKGTWFLDPFAWQLLMAIGLAVGLGLLKGEPRRNLILVALSATGVAIGAAVTTDGFGLAPGLFDQWRQWADLDKTVLGLGRLVHFACLAYLVYALRVTELMRKAAWYEPLCLIGRNGLWMFAILSVLDAVGQVLADGFGHSFDIDCLLVLGGLSALYGCARLLESRRIPTGLLVPVPVRSRTPR